MKTKKSSLIILMILLSIGNLVAQEWAPIGATWYYTRHKDLIPADFYTGFVKMESVGDTLIQGYSCKHIVETYDFLSNGGNDYYMYSDTNNKVYNYRTADTTFCLLYDFDAIKGDSFVLNCYDSVIVHVDSISSIMINGVSRKKLLYNSEDNIFFGFGGWVIEGIGDLIHMFPTPENFIKGPLRCYEDNNIVFFQNDATPCEYTVDVEELMKVEKNVKISPNPFTNFFQFNLDENSIRNIEINIFNLMGSKQFFEYEIQNNTVLINTQSFQKGFYLLEISSENTTFYKKISKY